MAEDKKTRSIIAPLIIGIFIPIAAIILMVAFSKYEVLIKENDGNFYRAQALVVAGNVLICSRDLADFSTRKDALESKEKRRRLSFVSMKNIEAIQMLNGLDDTGPSLQAWQPALKDYVGDYTVNAASNHGFMSLRAGGGSLFGTIRFPDWGKGATEYLKNVRIVGGKIYFTRSATTPQEIKRLGTNKYFVQNYSGEYFRSGGAIRGFYTVNGSRKSWEAFKNK